MPKRRFGNCLPSRLMPSGAGSRAVREAAWTMPESESDSTTGQVPEPSMFARSIRRQTPNHRKPRRGYFAIQYSISAWVSLNPALPSDAPFDRTNPFIAANLPVPPRICPTAMLVRLPAASA